MFPSTMDDLSCQRVREMREQAALARRVHRLAVARRWERRAARAAERARQTRDAVR